jgi:hypothetical protein
MTDLYKLKEYLQTLEPFTVTLGKTEVFPPSPSSDGAAVVVVRIYSPELHRINKELEDVAEWKASDFPDYKPHLTIAYVKPEVADKYVGLDTLEGDEHEVTELVISDAEKKHHVVKFCGEKTKTAKASPDDLAKVTAIVREYHQQFMPQLEFPTITIVNSLRSGWLGQDSWSPLNPTNTKIKIQQSILADEKILRSVVAHELCHHEDDILNYANLLPWQRKNWDAHGVSWRAVAARMNAVLGANFVNKTSDMPSVKTDTGKKYYLAIIKWHNGTLRYAVTFSPSQKQVEFMQQKMTSSRDIVKLFTTTDPDFVNGPNLGTGWLPARSPEATAKLQQFWDSGEEVPVPAPPKKTPLNHKAVGAKIFNEAKAIRYSSAMVKKFLIDPNMLQHSYRDIPTSRRLYRQKPPLTMEDWTKIADVIQYCLDLTLPAEFKGVDVTTLRDAQAAGKIAQQGDRNSYIPRINVDPVGLHREPLWPGDDELASEDGNPPVFKMIATEPGEESTMGQMGQVYLLHFDKKLAHAAHYLGWALDAQTRIDQHAKATSGVSIIRALKMNNITFTVAKIWDNVSRGFERRLKNQGGLSRHCPICKQLGLDRDSQPKKPKQPAPVPVPHEEQTTPAQLTFGPDFIENE